MFSVLGRSGLGLAAAAALLWTAACSRPAEPEPTPKPAPTPAAPPPVVVPVPLAPEPPLTRADMLRAVGQAASAYAEGAPTPPAVAGLAGRRFQVRQPFGCAGPAASDAADGYVLDPKSGSMRVTVRAVQWDAPAWLAALGDDAPPEVIEGFWLRRPWISGAACPAIAPSPEAAATPETVGLAQVFASGSSRLLRRGGRPYRVTVRAVSGQPPSAAGGLRLVLEGRIAEARGQPIRCRASGPDERPVCLVVVELDRVAFEDAQGKSLGEWRE